MFVGEVGVGSELSVQKVLAGIAGGLQLWAKIGLGYDPDFVVGVRRTQLVDEGGDVADCL